MEKKGVFRQVIRILLYGFPFLFLLIGLSMIVFADEGITLEQSTAVALLSKFGTIALAAIALTAVATAAWYKRVKRKLNWLWVWLALLLALGIAYSVLVFFAEEAEHGIVVCETQQNCVIAMHIHATFDVQVCGEEKSFGLETGELSATHTHKDGAGNYVHFHERLPYDPATETLLDTAPLLVSNIFESIGERFTPECLYGYCNGQMGPGGEKTGRVTMQVNGLENTQFQEYIWKDGDVIRIAFE